LKNFENIKDKSFSFSSCEGCGAKCCSGLYGSNFSEITLEEFEKVYTNFAILFSFGDLHYLKANLILTKELEHCKYIKDDKCTIYDNRPSVCKTYPLSPNIDNDIYIDTTCPALSEGEDMISKGSVNNDFFNKVFENYQDKYLETHFHLEKFNNKDDFECVLNIKGMEFFKYKNKTEDRYLKMHQASLVYL
jgi:Fe-S-cluster containining protein